MSNRFTSPYNPTQNIETAASSLNSLNQNLRFLILVQEFNAGETRALRYLLSSAMVAMCFGTVMAVSYLMNPYNYSSDYNRPGLFDFLFGQSVASSSADSVMLVFVVRFVITFTLSWPVVYFVITQFRRSIRELIG